MRARFGCVDAHTVNGYSCVVCDGSQAYTRAVDLDHENTDYQGHLGDAGSFLSNKQMASVLSEIYNEAGKNLENPILCGIVDKPDGQQSLWRCEGMVRVPSSLVLLNPSILDKIMTNNIVHRTFV